MLKIDSPQISHKSEVNGVALNLLDDAAVRAAFATVTERARLLRPAAEIAGVTVQSMITYPNSYELILGTAKDPVFGPVIMVGLGGVAAEVFQDRALGLPPLNDVLARRMLESLRSWPLLCGYRGKPGANIPRLIEIILRFSCLVADCAEIKELERQPAFGHAGGRRGAGRPAGRRPLRAGRGEALCATWRSALIPRNT